jgi:NADPH:quinone reductase-like Zn-dependent oxidoreductase
MKAMTQDRYGPPGVMTLREIDDPPFGDDEVLVRVRAAAVNPPDWAGVTGVPYIARTEFGLRRPSTGVRGSDLAGVVEAIGRGVTRFRVGDEVFGSTWGRRGAGTFAERTVVTERDLAPKPATATFEQAAAVPMAGLTALRALRDVGQVRRGQKVLITGAGGGIGTFAVQLAALYGATVTGVCATAKVDLVRSLGADHVIDYTRDDFTAGDERYDVILDNVLAHPLSRLVRVLNRSGTLIPNGGQFYKRWIASMGVILVKAPLLSLVVPQRIRPVRLARRPEDLLVLKELVESGTVTPVVGRTYPLSQTAEALAFFGEGHATGKVVIVV